MCVSFRDGRESIWSRKVKALLGCIQEFHGGQLLVPTLNLLGTFHLLVGQFSGYWLAYKKISLTEHVIKFNLGTVKILFSLLCDFIFKNKSEIGCVELDFKWKVLFSKTETKIFIPTKVSVVKSSKLLNVQLNVLASNLTYRYPSTGCFTHVIIIILATFCLVCIDIP